MKKICLSLIVKNELKNILSCLNSVDKVVDFVHILDTGSTDQTKELIKEWASKSKIPTTIDEFPFTNFGEMRTMAFNLAKKTYDSDYILTLDARHILNVSEDLSWKDKLLKDSYEILLKRIGLHYFNMRLLKTSLEWKCRGIVHEYWEYAGASRDQLSNVFITENGIETNKRGKIEWYKDLLEKGLSEETDELLKLRYLFYLANSLYDLGKYQDAIQKYLDRLKYQGWIEELWYCNYRIGMSYENIHQPEAAIGYYLKCLKLIPTRAENLYRLSHLYRLQGDMQLAFQYAMLGLQVPKPEGLFVESEIYEYLLHFETSISGYHINREIAKLSLMKLMSMKLPDTYANTVRNNNRWYT